MTFSPDFDNGLEPVCIRFYRYSSRVRIVIYSASKSHPLIYDPIFLPLIALGVARSSSLQHTRRCLEEKRVAMMVTCRAFNGGGLKLVGTKASARHPPNPMATTPTAPSVQQSQSSSSVASSQSTSSNNNNGKPADYVYFERTTAGFSDDAVPRSKAAQPKLEHYYKVAVESAIERNQRYVELIAPSVTLLSPQKGG